MGYLEKPKTNLKTILKIPSTKTNSYEHASAEDHEIYNQS